MAAKPISCARRVELGDGLIDYVFVRVPRRRHLHILVDDEARVELRAPWRCSHREADAALREHGPWVIQRIQRARDQHRLRTPLRSGVELPLLDDTLTLRVRMEAQMELALSSSPPTPAILEGGYGKGMSCARVHRRGGFLYARVDTPRAEELRDALRTWFRAQAEQTLPGRLDTLAAELRLRPSRVTVRGQRTRWGSCSARGAISLNWRLVLLPSELADYVLVHELCHLRHLDHSPRFWDMVRALLPDVDRRRARIREIQATLPL